jgi:hypothetical protein
MCYEAGQVPCVQGRWGRTEDQKPLQIAPVPRCFRVSREVHAAHLGGVGQSQNGCILVHRCQMRSSGSLQGLPGGFLKGIVAPEPRTPRRLVMNRPQTF